MQRVFVLDSQKRPLMPCHPARARQLLDRGKAAVFRRVPFTLILKGRTGGDVQPVEARVDPGSKTTGLALVARFPRGDQVVWAANLGHRGQAITAALDKRRAIRRGRRGRKTRYRAPRFLNRTRPAGWLPPSLQSRVDNVQAWARRLQRLCPLTSVAVETVRFDTQLIENPNLQGTDYQRGTLADWELREYLLYRHGHTCAYCGGLANDPVLEREHVVPRSRGGSNRVANQVIACRTCNEAKGNALPEQWLAQLRASHRKIDTTRARNMEKVFAGLRPSLRDAAAVNATRYATGRALQTLGLPTTFWSGGRTKKNRSDQGYAKDHWTDAACVGEAGSAVRIPRALRPLIVQATGHGSRQFCRMDKFGFPRTKPKPRRATVRGFRTGDLVHARVTTGKKQGAYQGRVAVRSSGSFNITTANGVVQGIAHRFCRKTQSADGYHYNLGGRDSSPTSAGAAGRGILAGN